jgi:hypothetical protein
MKIPTLLATGPVGGGIPYGQASPGAFSQGAVALASAGETLHRTGVRALDEVKRLEEDRRRQQQLTTASEMLLGYGSRLEAASQELLTGRRDPVTGQVLEEPASHQDYVARLTERERGIRDELLQSTKDVELKTYLTRMFNQAWTSRQIDAQKFATRLWVDREKGSLIEQRAETLRQMETATTPQEREAIAERHRFVVSQKGPVLGEDGVAAWIEDFNQRIVIAEATKAADRGESVDAYAGKITDPIKLASLREHSVRQQEHRETLATKNWNDAKAMAWSEYYADARSGQMTTPEFERLNRFWNFNPAEQRAVLDAITNRDVEDDPLVLKEIRLRSRAPELGQADVEWLAEQYAPADGSAPRINGKTFEHWNAVYTQTARANAAEQRTNDRIAKAEARDRERDERAAKAEERAETRIARAERREQEREAKDRLREARLSLERGLRANDLNEAISHAGKTALALAEDELVRRVRNGEDPDRVATELLPKYIAHVGLAAQARVTMLRKASPVRTLEELGPAADAMKRFSLTREQYNQVVRQLREAEAIEQAMVQLGTAKPEKSAATPAPDYGLTVFPRGKNPLLAPLTTHTPEPGARPPKLVPGGGPGLYSR